MSDYSYLSNADPIVIESMYQQFLTDPDSVDVSWRYFFQGFEFSNLDFSPKKKSDQTTPAKSVISTDIKEELISDLPHDAEELGTPNFRKEVNVINLIGAYRARGHLFTKTNPVRTRRAHPGSLELDVFGLSEADLDTQFKAGARVGLPNGTLRQITEKLDKTYRQSVAVEYKYIRDPKIVAWLQDKMEKCENTYNFDSSEKKQLLHKLNHAVGFEQFLHTKFVGQKRFSLEGGETIIPALDTVVERGADMGIEEFVIGMAHRGRLNVLANILDKSYEKIFSEFSGKGFKDGSFSGDVKYHLGFSTDKKTKNDKKVHLSLTPNPSHLEAVDPVVEGIVRAKLEKNYSGDTNKIAPILIHGDASIAGQGVVYEVIQMAKLDGYHTGGTIHIVLNNQIGFTTNYLDSRSSIYCTDVAKVTLSPVFHVNADDVEAVVYTVNLALEYRQKFHTDVFIDLLGYRKHGHNEGDDPRFTQPILYKTIAKHPNPREIYLKKLVAQGALSQDSFKEMEAEFKKILQTQLDSAKQKEEPDTPFLGGVWQNFRFSNRSDFEKSPKTGVKKELLLEVAKKITHLPTPDLFLSKVRRFMNNREKMVFTSDRIDWGMAEHLAFGTLLADGTPIRVSGQDVERSTFAHRHAVLKYEDSEEEYIPLSNISEKQAPFTIYNSLLSEFGVLGFEFGYAMATPDSLTIWEAQFGDFTNGAQTIIDQFISSCEAKWQRMIGMVLLLPHGYEGQGPEHSSARPERFLSMCAEDNMFVANCTTPANLFHIFRRQMATPFRKPLVIFTPKSLLRHPKCISAVKDFEEGTSFQEVIDDEKVTTSEVKRILFCTGKVYYDLLDYQEKENRHDVAVVRVEQLYPLPEVQLSAIVEKYQGAECYWVQEEPENMGAWVHMLRTFRIAPLKLSARKESAATSTGFAQMHQKQQAELVYNAFN
ncbi:MAG: 2-oxoglutarate dehydrogenase E1 component [bacterium]|jgi:2-oxoglutarate dehydrogenase E1 component